VSLYYKTAYRPTPMWGWNCVAAYIILSWAFRLAVEEGTLNMLPSSKIVPALKHHTVKTRLGTAVYFQLFQLYLTLALSRCEWSSSRSGHFIPKRGDPICFEKEALGPQRLPGRCGEEIDV